MRRGMVAWQTSGSPAGAGIDPIHAHGDYRAGRFPRRRGDRPIEDPDLPGEDEVPPQARG